MYSEQSFSTAGIITAYDLNDITFTHPLQLHRRYLNATGDFTIRQADGKPVDGDIIPIHKVEGAHIEEDPETDTNGHTTKVTVTFEVFHPTNGDYETLKQLRRPHHLLLSHDGDHLSLIRATEEGWHYEESGGDMLKVKLTIHNVNGQQRILD